MIVSSILAFIAPFAFAPAKPELAPHQKALLDASALMKKSGLSKEALYRREMLCIQGAIFKAVTGNAGWPFNAPEEQKVIIRAALRAAEKAAKVQECDYEGTCAWESPVANELAHWNNKPERTKREVVRVLRKAALT